MKFQALALITSAIFLSLSSSAWAAAGPPITPPMGPPVAAPPVTPPIAPPVATPPVSAPPVTAPPFSTPPVAPPAGVPLGPPTAAANIIGNLSAANASQTGLENASTSSILNNILIYQIAMNDALAVGGDQTASITAAREQLATAANKQLTPDAISEVDGLLGISGADPTLGTIE